MLYVRKNNFSSLNLARFYRGDAGGLDKSPNLPIMVVNFLIFRILETQEELSIAA